VQKAIYFEDPQRLPLDMFVSGAGDVFHARTGMGSDARLADGTDQIHVDHFGCRFEIRNRKTMGQPVDFPLEDIHRLDDYRFPDPYDEGRYAPIAESLREAGDRYVYTDIIWFTFFERMHFIHGFGPTLEDLYLQRPLMEEFADRVIDYNIAVVREVGRRFKARVHGITTSDDWGSQEDLLISKELFRDFFLPRYRTLFDVVREQGMDVWFHSCGCVMDLIPAFIEMGVQVLNLQQPRIFDIAELGRSFAGDVCFNIPVDIQHTMPHGSREDIRREARELLAALATEHGGFIASEHPDYVGNGIDPRKGVWAYEAFREADPFRTK